MPRLKAVAPILGEDTNALPVKNVESATAFYEMVLGFSVVSRDTEAAALTRDNVRIRLVRKPNHKPGEAGSLAFAVDDLERMHREIQTRGGHPGEFGTDEWDDKQYRTFFLREDENGYCYCFYQPTGDHRTAE
jgi:catechol 2,3-dioxygenase-like lactoylglutathione lyase family enzyme